jgi:hypothetical protein
MANTPRRPGDLRGHPRGNPRSEESPLDGFPPEIADAVDQLLETEMFGSTVEEVITHLIRHSLRAYKLEGWWEPRKLESPNAERDE